MLLSQILYFIKFYGSSQVLSKGLNFDFMLITFEVHTCHTYVKCFIPFVEYYMNVHKLFTFKSVNGGCLTFQLKGYYCKCMSSKKSTIAATHAVRSSSPP